MSEEERQAFRELGLTDAQINHHLGAESANDEPEPDVYAVWPENWQALQLFLALDTQWQRAIPPMGGA
ncbi:DUF1799 domain-containing protein, partial [Chitinimonas sp.]|uniref:DUF1799 domain-containing protein n=1 Tax=Chitinimonas sp. TaxID=1934313 RepID=UPI0035B1CE86